MANIFSRIGRGIGDFFTGSPEIRENVSTLRPEQEGLYQQLIKSGLGKGAGGAFGGAADYYRGLLGDNREDFDAFAAPQISQYYQDILPGLSEQFAGLGAGGLSSSGFRNAQTQSAVDLAERLGALRANLRQAGAQGLQGLGQLGLQQFSQNIPTQAGSQGFLSSIAPAVGTALGSFAGPLGSAAGGALGALVSNFSSRTSAPSSGERTAINTGPYGATGPQASPQLRR